MNRRNIRYLLRRIKTYSDTKDNDSAETVKYPKLPTGFKKSFEEQPRFRGWMGYQVTWDVDESGWNIVFLNKSLEEQWNELLTEKVPELLNG